MCLLTTNAGQGNQAPCSNRERRSYARPNGSSRYWHFPADGDGQIKIRGQGLAVAWYGWRWKFPYAAKAQNQTGSIVL